MKKTIEKLELLLDCYFQKLSNNKKCYYCGKKAQASHHVVRRANKVYRWDPANALPVCFVCHSKIHDGNLKEPELNLPRKFVKEYLLERCLGYKEFLTLNLVLLCKKLNIKIPIIEIVSKKKKLSKYMKEKREKYNEYMRKKRKELYRKKKEYLKNKLD